MFVVLLSAFTHSLVEVVFNQGWRLGAVRKVSQLWPMESRGEGLKRRVKQLCGPGLEGMDVHFFATRNLTGEESPVF